MYNQVKLKALATSQKVNREFSKETLTSKLRFEGSEGDDVVEGGPG